MVIIDFGFSPEGYIQSAPTRMAMIETASSSAKKYIFETLNTNDVYP